MFLFLFLFLFFVIVTFYLTDLYNKLKALNIKTDKLSSEILNLLENKSSISTPKTDIKQLTDENTTKDLQESLSKEDTSDELIEFSKKTNDMSENIEKINDETVSSLHYETKKTKKQTRVEQIFMGNIFNKIGAIALLIGIGIFIKLISPYFIFINEMKIAVGFFVGLTMIFSAFKIQVMTNMKNYAEVLMGTGFGALLMSNYCAASLFRLFNVPIATAISGIIIIAIYYLADKQKTVSLLAIGLIGGYMNPFFVNSNIFTNFLFCYFIFLNIISLVFIYRNPDKQWINILNLCFSFLTVIMFAIIKEPYSLFHILVLWGIYISYDILTIIREQKIGIINKCQIYLNFIVLTLLAYVLFHDDQHCIGALLLIVALVYSFLALFKYTKIGDKENSYLYSCVFSVIIATFFFSENLFRTYLWLFEALTIVYFAFNHNFKKLYYCGIGLLGVSISNIFVIPDIYNVDTNVTFNTRFWAFIPSTLCCFLASICFKKYNKIDFSHILNFIAITLIYSYSVFEIVMISNHFSDQGYLRCVSYAVINLFYALSLGKIANITKCKFYEKISYIVAIIALVLILASEILAQNVLPFLNLRILIYTLAVGTAYFYFKWTNISFFKIVGISLIYLYIVMEFRGLLPSSNSLSNNLLFISVWLAYAINLNYLSKKQNDIFQIFSYVTTGIAIPAILLIDISNLNSNSNLFPIINTRLLAYSLIFCNVLYWTKNIKREFYKYFFVILGFIYINFECWSINCPIIVALTFYAGLISIIGIFRNKQYLKISGIWLSIIAIIRLFMFDFAKFESLYKLIVFLILGGVLMAISYFYNKYKQ